MRVGFLLVSFITLTGSIPRSINAVHKMEAVTRLTNPEGHTYYFEIKKTKLSLYVPPQQRLPGGLQSEDFLNSHFDHVNMRLEPEHPVYPGAGQLAEVIDLQAKNRICAYIFSSAFFDMEEEDVVPFAQVSGIFSHDISTHSFVNPIMPRQILVLGRVMEEHVFACVTRHRITRQLITYYISPLYNLNEQTGRGSDTIWGRFIFFSSTGEPDGILNLTAIAEESAGKNENVVLETNLAYYLGRNEAQPLQDVANNLVCKSNLVRKIRLCTIALNSSQFRGKIRFYPRENQVEPNCEKRLVLARVVDEVSAQHIEMTYEEWMMGCKAVYVGSNEDVTFYISRGIQPNTLIVYKLFIGNLYSAHAGLSHVALITGTGVISTVGNIRTFV